MVGIRFIVETSKRLTGKKAYAGEVSRCIQERGRAIKHTKVGWGNIGGRGPPEVLERHEKENAFCWTKSSLGS